MTLNGDWHNMLSWHNDSSETRLITMLEGLLGLIKREFLHHALDAHLLGE